MFTYWEDNKDEPTPITIGMMREAGLSHDDIISFCGLAIMLKDAILQDDGEYRAIAIRKIEELENKIEKFAYAISRQF